MVSGSWIRLLIACCLALTLGWLVTGCYDGDDRTEAQRRKDKRNDCETMAICMAVAYAHGQARLAECRDEQKVDPTKKCNDLGLLTGIAMCPTSGCVPYL